MIFASESTRWYDPSTAQAVGVVRGANGKERAATLRDARQCGYVRSVTSIIKEAAAPGLEAWKRKQLALSALTLPRPDGMPADDFLAKIEADAVQEAIKARDRGTALHAAIQRHILGQPIDENWRPHIEALEVNLKLYGLSLTQGIPERTFVTQQYGGTVDWHNAQAVLDFKSKQRITPDVRAWDEHGMQLVAYDNGLCDGPRVLLNAFVGVEDARVRIHEWPMDERGRLEAMWNGLLHYSLAKDRMQEAA